MIKWKDLKELKPKSQEERTQLLDSISVYNSTLVLKAFPELDDYLETYIEDLSISELDYCHDDQTGEVFITTGLYRWSDGSYHDIPDPSTAKPL